MSKGRKVKFVTTLSEVEHTYEDVDIVYDDDFLHVVDGDTHRMWALGTIEWIEVELKKEDKDDRKAGASVLSFVRPDVPAN